LGDRVLDLVLQDDLFDLPLDQEEHLEVRKRLQFLQKAELSDL